MTETRPMHMPSARGRPRSHSGLALLLLCGCLLGFSPADLCPAVAGDGGVVTEMDPDGVVRKKLDLLVYFDYMPPRAELVSGQVAGEFAWDTVFERASALLFDATDGQLRLGTVTFATDISQKAGADDVWVSGESTLTAEASSGSFGRQNYRISLTQLHKSIGNDNCTSFRNDDRGYLGIVHELGHAAFNLRDEYSGSACSGQARRTCFHCSVGGGINGPIEKCDDQVHACIMDAGTTQTGRNLRTEFCVAYPAQPLVDHRVMAENGALSNQQVSNLGSCWSTMTGPKAPVRIDPPALPLIRNPLPAGAAYRPTFIIQGGAPALVYVFDSSESLRLPAPGGDAGSPLSWLDAAKAAAQATLSSLAEDEFVGVVSFSTNASVAMALEQAGRAREAGSGIENARDAIGLLQPGGWTNVGGGLEAGLLEIERLLAAQGVENVAGLRIVLFSDGVSTVQNPPVADVTTRLQARGVRVFGVSLGRGESKSVLSSLAFDTRGDLVEARTADELASVLPRLVQSARSEDVLLDQTNLQVAPDAQAPMLRLGSGDTRSDLTVRTLDIAPDTVSATFRMTHRAGAPLTLGLGRPDGSEIAYDPGLDAVCVTPDGGGTPDCTNPTGIQFDHDATYTFFRVPNPTPGPWAVRVLNAGAVVETVSLLVTAEQPKVAVAAEVLNGGLVDYPEPMRLEVSVYRQVPVLGAVVTAVAHHPGGFSETIELRDSGLPEDGDAVAQDGFYSALYGNYRTAAEQGGDGLYRFDVTVDNVSGVGKPRDELPVEEQEVEPIPPFHVQVEACTYVRGIPDEPTLAPGSAQLQPGTAPAAGEMDADTEEVVPVLSLQLRAVNEFTTLRSLQLTSSGTGREDRLGPVTLYLDADGDGQVDNPYEWLDRREFGADDGSLTFEREGVLALVGTQASTQLLVTLGRPATQSEDPEARVKPAARVLAPPASPLLFAIAALLGLLCVSRRAPAGRAQRALGLVCACSLALLVTGALGCGTGDIYPEPTVTPGGGDARLGTYAFVVTEQGVEALGVRTQGRVPVTAQQTVGDTPGVAGSVTLR